MSTPSPEPLLVTEDLRVDVDGVPSVDGLALRTTGEHVLILGAPRALMEAATGLRRVVRGRLAVRGLTAEGAVHAHVVAGCTLDPAMPPAWTPLEYVTWSARLAGHSTADATTLAKDAVARVQLGAAATTPLARLIHPARRATVLAGALATDAKILVVEDPLAGLAEEIARAWARVLVQALADKAWIVFAPRIPLTSPLAMEADEAIVVAASRIEAQGAPAEIAAAERRFVARMHGPLDVLAPRVIERGGRFDIQGAQVFVDLGKELSTFELLGMCADAAVVVVELHPVSRALA